jgi:hypothetical protein
LSVIATAKTLPILLKGNIAKIRMRADLAVVITGKT